MNLSALPAALACLLAAALACADATAAPAAADLQVEIDSRQQDLLLIDGARRKPLKLARITDVDGVVERRALLADSGNGHGHGPGELRYLLIEVDTASRADRTQGHCGAGIETDLVWLALDSSLQVRKHDAYRIASCLQSIEAGERVAAADGSLRVSLLRPGRDGEPDREVTVRYDAADPSQGLQVHDRLR
ncbi:hypothetical protein GLA29479_2710 [Lysobacter antibioticus]|uniref:hypothetical protein n=1 Tax=Lysobacter antibioticus TaxID=84531 RepID=UPI00071F0C82|nr:hypothetical protein [Lysobacter antibioticus]ALN63576.1 hypothetical protein GLA29479_2710 [Lysobacter antibioticus]